MYDKIKKAISEPYYQGNYSNDGQRFVAWYLIHVHSLKDIEAEDNVVDGPGDKQIDAIYIDHDEETIYIIQGKFTKREIIDRDVVGEIVSSFHHITNLEQPQETSNPKLREKIRELIDAKSYDYKMKFQIITTAKDLTKSAQESLLAFNQHLSKLSKLDKELDVDANAKAICRKELEVKYKGVLDEVEEKSINHEFNLENCERIQTTIAKRKVVIALIPLAQCIEIEGIDDDTLFDKNVRKRLGSSNSVNKGIKNTIGDDKKAKTFFSITMALLPFATRST